MRWTCPGSSRCPVPLSPRRLSPAAFRYQLVEQASAAGACLVLPEGTEPRIVQAAVACADRGIARSVLLGPPDQVRELARSLGLRLPDGVTVVDPQAVAERYVAPLAALRKHRGWTEEMARDHLADPITVGTMMIQQGEVDGLVAGAVHTTAATARPAPKTWPTFYPERGVGAHLRHRTPGGHDQLQHRHLWLGRRCRQGRRGDPGRARA
jgi:phosphate acetyltransferase